MSEENESSELGRALHTAETLARMKVADWRFRVAAVALTVLLAGHFALAWLTFRELSAANRWSTHTYSVLTGTIALSEDLSTMESSFRGYALTGRTSFRDQWEAGRSDFEGQLATVRALTADNAEQQERLDELEALYGTWSASQIQAGVRADPTPAWRVRLHAEASEPAKARDRAALSGRMRDMLARTTSAEWQLLTERATRADRLENRASQLLGAIALSAIALGGVLFWMILSRTRRLETTNGALLRTMSERTAAAAAIRRLNQRQELILQSAGEGIIGINADGEAVFANAAATRMLGVAGDEVLGQSFDTLLLGAVDADEAGVVREAIGSALHDGRTHELGDAVFARRDGGMFAVELIVTAAVDEGEVVGAVVTFQDVTKRREIERMKDEFVSVVSHELRTPLTSIRGSLGLLASGQLGDVAPRGQRMLDIAVQNTDRLVRLINDILDVERMASGKAVMHRADVEVARVVRDAVDAVQGSAQKASVRITVEEPPPFTLYADADRLVQTLTNLLSNAIKFSPAGGAVRLCARQHGRDVRFTVEDEGRGIPAEHLDRIFERFHQVDSSDARGMGGTGLGLAICRSIVDHHDGRIWAESEPGTGSRFHFTIPLLAPAPVERGLGDDRPGGVLVIEDDPDLARVLLAMFRGRGIHGAHAASAAEALEKIRTAPPELIVLDVVLPDGDGYQIVEALRTHDKLRNAPLIVYSAHEVDDDARRRLELGPTEFVTKSRVPPEALERRVAVLLGHTVTEESLAHAR
jgi:PAS domain S-box-containing protein